MTRVELVEYCDRLLATASPSAAMLSSLSMAVEWAPRPLTRRQVEVLETLAAGCSTYVCGRRLGISARTVHAHLRSIYTRLGVNNLLGALNASKGRREQ